MTKLHPTEVAESKPDYGKPPERWYKEADDPFRPRRTWPLWLLAVSGIGAAGALFADTFWEWVLGLFFK